MEPETKAKIQTAVLQILKSSDMDTTTEQDIRAIAEQSVGIQLSDLSHKILVRQVIESYLDSLDTLPAPPIEPQEQQEVDKKPVVSPVSDSVICKLSNKRDVAIGRSGQKTVVRIRDLIWKDGKQVPSPKSINLSNEQWSIFRKNMPAVEEAIAKVESKLKSKHERKQTNDMNDRSKLEIKHDGVTQSRTEAMQTVNEVACTKPRGIVPVEITRFDGKNYWPWADRMETYLKRLRVAYVLSDPCPSAVGVEAAWELRQCLSAIEQWNDDDHICRQNILNSLCDRLYFHYSKKSGTARQLWEELKLIYLTEEHGAKATLVKKYIDFQIVEEKPMLEQVQEFHNIADSINACGMLVEEKFHVNVILSKLPPSWKPFGIEQMKEDYIPVWMLMNRIKAVGETGGKGNKGEVILQRPEGSGRNLGVQRIPMKKPGVHPMSPEIDKERKFKFCCICKKRGHLPEMCWFREFGNTTNEHENGNKNVGSANVVSGSNIDGVATE